MKRRSHELHSDESGFTLIELLAAMAIGLLVLMAAFMVLDRATSVSKEIADRQDAVQRGRQAMELIVRDLRSQVCLGDETEPITVAADDRVTFYAGLSDGSTPVEQRTIRYDAASKTMVEDPTSARAPIPTSSSEALPRRAGCWSRQSSRSRTAP